MDTGLTGVHSFIVPLDCANQQESDVKLKAAIHLIPLSYCNPGSDTGFSSRDNTGSDGIIPLSH